MPDRLSNRITFQNLSISFRLRQTRLIRQWISRVISSENKGLDLLAFNFCGDPTLAEINRNFLKHNTLTDIITFDYTEGARLSGEIYISIDRVKDNARIYKVSMRNELHRVIIHGVLHLCGYGDKTPSEKAEMTEKEDFYLSLRSF